MDPVMSRRLDDLLNPAVSGIKRDTILRYLRALGDLVIERGAPGRALGRGAQMVGSERTLDGTPAWADDVLQREMKALDRRVDWLEVWLEHPRPTRGVTHQRCVDCGRGLGKGVRYCPMCGKEVGSATE